MAWRPDDLQALGPQPDFPSLQDAAMDGQGSSSSGWPGVIAIIAAVKAAVSGGGAALNSAGVCIPKWRRPTDEEVLDRATIAATSRRQTRMQGEHLPSASVSRYEDPVGFTNDHPDRCEIILIDTMRDEERNMVDEGRPWGRFRHTADPGDAEDQRQIVTNRGCVTSSPLQRRLTVFLDPLASGSPS